MTTTPTNLPIPSESPKDLKFNAGKIDEFVNSLTLKYIDRFGIERFTVAGLESLVREIVGNLGWVPFGTFEAGATLTDATQTLKYEADGNYYRWDGSFIKVIPAGSTPDNSGGVAQGAWVNVTDLTLRNELASNIGASLIGSESGDTVQKELKNINENIDELTDEIFQSFADAKSTIIKSNVVSIKFKYGYVNYIRTGDSDETRESSGDGYLFYDAVGTAFKINEEKRNRNDSGVFCFSEIWQTKDLDPTYFYKLTQLGVGTIVLYTYYGFSFETHSNFIELCDIYGFGVVIQAVPNQEYTSDLDHDFQFISPLLNHKCVVGLYLLDEPTIAVYPFTRQSAIITKAKSLSSKPIYAATNAESTNGIPPIYKDFDFVFASNYSHFVDINGLLYYASTTWASLEENMLRSGRLIPLMTSYWYESEAALNTSQMTLVNNWISSHYDNIGMWMFFGNRNSTFHYLENNETIFNISLAALSARKQPNRMVMRRVFFSTGSLPDSYKLQRRPANISEFSILDSSSTGTWWPAYNAPGIRRGESFTLDFGKEIKLQSIRMTFIDRNGGSNVTVVSLTYNPQLGGILNSETKTMNGGGETFWRIQDQDVYVRKFQIKAESMSTASSPSDIIYLTSLAVVYQ